MVLTEKLTEKFEKGSYKFTQTASKTEQLALSHYIRDGQLKAQIKKTRRFYISKTKEFYLMLKSEFPNANIQISENQLQIIMQVPFIKSTDVFIRNKISVNIAELKDNMIKLIINTASIKNDRFNDAVLALKSSIN